MLRKRYGIVRRVGTLCAVALLLLPLVLSGHGHQAGQRSASDTCATCAVTHFSPVTTAPPLPQLSPQATALAPSVQMLAAPPRLCHSRPSGRAPPHSSPLRTV